MLLLDVFINAINEASLASSVLTLCPNIGKKSTSE